MDEVLAALRAAIKALRAAEVQAQTQTRIAAAAGERSASTVIMSELGELRQAAGDLHRAVATLVEGAAGHGTV